jgi:RNA polymerase sigma-70 factor, ECF subfamily
MRHDSEIIAAVVDGDREAFGSLVERYWSMAVALAMSKLQNGAEADDVAQESFVKAYTHLASLRDRARFAGWLARIVCQASVDRIRRKQRTREVPLQELVVSEAVRPPKSFDTIGLNQSDKQAVRQAVAGLPEDLQKVIVMRFVGGLTSREIAGQLGKRPGTIRMWLHRAYQRLSRDLKGKLEEVTSK